MPYRDDSAGDYGQWINDPNQSWLNYFGMKADDVRQGTRNIASALAGAFSPVTDEGTKVRGSYPGGASFNESEWQWPPLVQEPVNAIGRVVGTPSNPGSFYDMSGVPEFDAQNQQDALTGLLAFYGGNALRLRGRAAPTAPNLLSDNKPSVAGAAVASAERPFDYHKPFRDVDGQITDYFRSSRDLLRRTNEDAFDPSLLDEIQKHGVGSEKIDNAITNRQNQGELLLSHYNDRASEYSSHADELNDLFQGRYDTAAESHPQFTAHTTELPESNLNYLHEYFDSGPSASRKMFNHLEGLDGIMSGEVENLRGHYTKLNDPPPGSLDNILSGHFGSIDQHQSNAQSLRDIANHTDAYTSFLGEGFGNWEKAVERRANAIEAIREKLRDRLSEHDIDALFSDTGNFNPIGAALAAGSDQPKGITAYHGSPHDFDKFSLDKIGTGEGAQAYGHGLYFAENEGVAKGYRDRLAGDNIEARNLFSGDAPIGDAYSVRMQAAIDAARPHTKHPDHARAVARNIIDSLENMEGKPAREYLSAYEAPKGWEQAYQGAAQALGDLRYQHNPGHMYQVRINADPNDFLDWDKPLSQQSEKVRNAVTPMLRADHQPYTHTVLGKDAVISIQGADKNNFLDRSAVSPLLREAGIPGIRYLDQQSRGTGQGTYNYSVFDDSIIEILKKYGLAGGVVGGTALNGLTSSDAVAGSNQNDLSIDDILALYGR